MGRDREGCGMKQAPRALINNSWETVAALDKALQELVDMTCLRKYRGQWRVAEITSVGIFPDGIRMVAQPYRMQGEGHKLLNDQESLQFLRASDVTFFDEEVPNER